MAESDYRRRFGDRRDGRLLRTISPYSRLMAYIMPKRNDAMNLYSDSVEISAQEQWFREKRREGWKGLGMLHLFIAAYIRTIASCPGINRFVSGQKIYARNNIEVVMMVKPSMTAAVEESAAKVVFEPTDTIYDVYRKLGEQVDEIRAGGANGTDRTAEFLARMPGLILKFIIWFLNLLDYFGWLPQSIVRISPFHGSMIITDLGSLGTLPVYHHIYNFGNLPMFISMGAKRRAVELNRAGAPEERKYVDYRLTMDERIVDGLYYANALKYLKYYLKNPMELEHPPAQVLEDVM